MRYLRSVCSLLFKEFWMFFALLFFGSLVWAHSRDPFIRKEFKVQGSKFKVSGITVLPRGWESSRFKVQGSKLGQRLPVVVYAHGSGGTWMNDGNVLRQFAELGLAAVGFDYDQIHPGVFEGEFAAVLDYVRRQSWADTNAIAWVGFSRGAQHTLEYLLKEAAPRERRPAVATMPQVYVRLAGGWIPGLDNSSLTTNHWPLTTILLVHGENDGIFPVDEAKRVAEFFNKQFGFKKSSPTTNHLPLTTFLPPVTLHVVPGHGHDFEADQPVVFRLIAEYCKAKLTPGHPLPEFPKLHPYPFLLCIAPAFVWLGFWLYLWRKGRATLLRSQGSERLGGSLALPKLTKIEVGLRVAAVVLGTLAVAETALHLVPPRLQVSPRTLQIARQHLLAPKWHEDFETLAALPIWQGQRLQTLLTHVELAHYTVYELVNWKVEDALYRQYVLSPAMGENPPKS